MARAAYLRDLPELKKAGADAVFTGEGEVALAFTEAILQGLGATPEQIDRERDRADTELFGESADGDVSAVNAKEAGAAKSFLHIPRIVITGPGHRDQSVHVIVIGTLRRLGVWQCSESSTSVTKNPVLRMSSFERATGQECNRAAVDRLDDEPMQSDATQAQPEPLEDPATLTEYRDTRVGTPSRPRRG